jgi:hypothetical protein
VQQSKQVVDPVPVTVVGVDVVQPKPSQSVVENVVTLPLLTDVKLTVPVLIVTVPLLPVVKLSLVTVPLLSGGGKRLPSRPCVNPPSSLPSPPSGPKDPS